MLKTLDGTEQAALATKPGEPARGVAGGLLVPTPPVGERECRWAQSLLNDEPALCAWLNQRPAAGDAPRRARVEGPCITNAYPVVAIALLSHNDRDMALRCLACVDTLTYRKGSYFVVLVENSTDASQELHEADIASGGYGFDVTLIRPDRNIGFAAGVNLAARCAFETGGADHLLLLNDDALIPDTSRDLLQELVAVSGLLPDVAAVGPKVHFERHPAGPDVIASAGGNFVDVPAEVGRRDPGLEDIIETDFVVGVCLLIPRRAWVAVGPFDASFFAYYEETEWCYRAQQLGFKSYCVRGMRVLHGDHDREYRKRHQDPATVRLAARNQVWLAQRHRWFCRTVAERLTHKYRQLLELGEQRAAHAMVEGMVLARRDCFPEVTSRQTRIAEIPRRAEASGREPPTVFFYMGRITRHKGVDIVAHLATQCGEGFEAHIRGISNLDPQVPEDNEYLHGIYETLKHSGAFRRNAVVVYGGFDDAARTAFLRRYADMNALLVHPARLEGFGLVQLEAMEYGIPVAADRYAGLASSFRDRSDPPIYLLDFASLRGEELLGALTRYLRHQGGRAQQRQRCRAYVASLPSARQMYLDYRQQFLDICNGCGIDAPAVALLSGAALYKVGGCGEWFATLGTFLRNDKGLRCSIITLPGGDAEPVPKYREALKGLHWEEFRIRRVGAVASPIDREKTACFREVIDLLASEQPPTSPHYSHRLRRFQQLISRQDYWSMCLTGFGDLVDCYMESRPGLSRSGVERGLRILLRAYLLENLLAKGLMGRCVYAENPGTGIVAAVGRDHGDWAAYVLGVHAFTDLHYENLVREWKTVSERERRHFRVVIRNILAYSVIKADLIICVSRGLEDHIRTRFADYPLPQIVTIPNALRTRASLASARFAEPH